MNNEIGQSFGPITTADLDAARVRAENEEIYDLLTSLAARGVSLRYSPSTDKVTASPASRLNEAHKDMLRKHKRRLFEATAEWERRKADRALEETGEIQNEQQVFDLARSTVPPEVSEAASAARDALK